jgi:hypothetical protein
MKKFAEWVVGAVDWVVRYLDHLFDSLEFYGKPGRPVTCGMCLGPARAVAHGEGSEVRCRSCKTIAWTQEPFSDG